MSQVDIETRIVVLENEISSLKSKFAKIESDDPWWKQRLGIFADDPSHAEAMKLGREWREKQTPNGNGGE
ncbi:MAG: hypothetical protein PSX80_08845 [bacterium]|nr:hypothetical protein [bacterium]